LPTFSFTQPDGIADTVVRGTPYALAWVDNDPENNARIELSLKVEGSDELLSLPGAGDLREDPDGAADSYLIATTNLTPATYYPVARITDGVVRDGNTPIVEVVSAYPFVVLQNNAPELVLLTPSREQSTTVFNGEYFDIRWTDRDDDSSAVISLFYDNNRVYSDGVVPITGTNEVAGKIIYATGIPEGTGVEGALDADEVTDDFLWDVRNLAPGQYYIFARITDGVNPVVERYSPGFVTIDKKPTFQFVEPDGFEDEVIQGGHFILTWLANDPDSQAEITLYLDTDTNPGVSPTDRGFELPLSQKIYDNNGQSVQIYTINTALLPTVDQPTPYYPLAKVVDSNNEPLLVYASNAITVVPNEAPSLTFARPSINDASVVQGGNGFEVRWNDLDPDFDPSAPQVLIELYYDTNSSGLDGILLQGSYESSLGVIYSSTGIPLQDNNASTATESQGRNVFHWDITNVPVGTYYVYAILKDGLQREIPLFQYSSSSIIFGSRWISSMNRTSPSLRFVRMPIRSPPRGMDVPTVVTRLVPTSLARALAKVRLPIPSRPTKSRCGSSTPLFLANSITFVKRSTA